MYSRRLGERVGAVQSQACERFGEVCPGEPPFEWLGEDLVADLEGEDPSGEVVERGGVGRREDLALEDAEVDLD
ncbi:MAG TPA: hypothetical protein VIM30_05035 [Candidatus Limnocylindrales bacterium]|jgi:hypothetical protein